MQASAFDRERFISMPVSSKINCFTVVLCLHYFCEIFAGADRSMIIHTAYDQAIYSSIFFQMPGLKCTFAAAYRKLFL